MFKLASREDIVRTIFGIPRWYKMSRKEETKLFGYLLDSANVFEALMCRILDCSAFCDEDSCFFCGESSQWCARFQKNIKAPILSPPK